MTQNSQNQDILPVPVGPKYVLSAMRMHPKG